MTGRDSFFRSPNPHRLYRDREHRIVFGVCAGVADYFGVDPLPVRAVCIVALVVFFAPVLLGYLAAAVILPARPNRLYRDAEEEAFWRSVSLKPDRTLAGLTQKFHDLERRLRGMEGYVASNDFTLNRQFRDLER
ncbi:MAG: envelope stress response membrane protein PspC [Azospirillaceae bacterium]|nr:envelope stress response membrane protein PspC [Azospirillaceae bacterium]